MQKKLFDAEKSASKQKGLLRQKVLLSGKDDD